MPSLVIIGAQWGDEGKGKLVDYLTSNADCVARFQGGNNAGHTLVVEGKTTKLHLIPSGVLREGVRCYLTAGVVIDPHVLKIELEQLATAGIHVTPDRLVLDRDAHLILDYHKALDLVKEEARGGQKIGTTGRGIGPCYTDRATRCGVRIAQLAELENLRPQLEENLRVANLTIEHVYGSKERVAFEDVWNTVQKAADLLLPFLGNASLELERALKNGAKVVFEGAQGTLLDMAHGTVPFVTSSHTISGGAAVGAGLGPKRIDHVLGVAKAYTTRVGEGPFPTELTGKAGDDLREKGREYGTLTGRPRRCGWFDAAALRRAARLNGFDSVAITKLDVLSGMDSIKVCIGYNLDGVELDDMPALVSQMNRVEPRYIELEGWQEDLSGIKKFYQLPAAARLYLSTISEIIGCPVAIVSVGPDREQTLYSSAASFVKTFEQA
jgi:adenylosuccinate synthase